MIEATDLTKLYGDQVALRGIDLTVSPGVVVGLIGPSGCGKTSLIRILTGISRPTSGEVRVFGEDPATLTTQQRTRFGYMPQLPVLFPTLSVWGNLTFISSIYGVPARHRRRRLMSLLELVDLTEHRHKQLANCSGGMQRRLALAATLVHNPELLYLDEPTAGVDPILRERFWAHFRGLRDEGKTIVVPTQYVGEAVGCDLVAVMTTGRLITVQPPGLLSRFAYGGDPLDVRLQHGWLARSEIERLAAAPFVQSVQRSEDGLLVVVDDAERDLPLVDRHFSESSIAIEPITPYDATFDDIFVRIVAAHSTGEERSAA